MSQIMIAIASLLFVAMVVRADEPTSRILFGSCIKQEYPIPILFTMAKERPQLLLFIGDNIYADTDDMTIMRQKYEMLGANRDFQKLTAMCTTLATWDDHDYGFDDSGAEYSKREASQQEFLDFWEVPADSPRRSQAGIYHARIFGPEGKRLQVILLDTRYFRSPLKKGERRVGGPYYPDDDAAKTILGEAQWQWLGKQLQKPADIRIIASSIQFAASAAGQETWSNLPAERQRMLNLIAETKAEGVFFISGDRHWSELSLIEKDAPYPLYDLTSSSLNQIHKRGTPTDNKFRHSETTYHQENFGVINIDWDAPEGPQILMQIKDIEGGVRIEKQVSLRELQ